MKVSRNYTSQKVKKALSGLQQRQQERNSKREVKKVYMSEYMKNYLKEINYASIGT